MNFIREKLKNEGFSEQLINLQKSLDRELRKFEEKIKISQDRIFYFEKKLNKARIKEDLEKTLFSLFNKKIDLNFSKQKNYFVRSLNNLYSDLQIAKKSFRGEFFEIENKINSFHENFRRKIEEIEQERKKELLSLRKQITYLKG
ncbi:MAG: hypothetical protein QXX68_00465 [Candidatus Pacearchaeota archaeon]